MATRMALASRIADDEVTLIDRLSFEQPRTQEAASILKALKLGDITLLVAVPDHDINVYKSLRNLTGVSVSPVADLNALSVLTPKRLLMTASALEAFQKTATAGRAQCETVSETTSETASETASET